MIKINIQPIEMLDEAKEDDLLKKYSKLMPGAAIQSVFVWVQGARRQRLRYASWMLKQFTKELRSQFQDLTDWYIEWEKDPLSWDDAKSQGRNEEYKIATAKKRALWTAINGIKWDIIGPVQKFSENLPSMKEKDINRYDSIGHLKGAVWTEVDLKRAKKNRKARDKHSKSFLEPENTEIVYEDVRFFIVRPETQTGSCFFGKKTKWCISQDGNQYFDEYTNDGKVFYFVIDDTKKEDDRFSKIAIQGAASGLEIFWDRYDDPHEMDQLEKKTDWSEHNIKAVLGAVENHLHHHPPEESGHKELFDLEDEISNGQHNNSYLNLTAAVEDEGDEVYINIHAELDFVMVLPLPSEVHEPLAEEAFELVIDEIVQDFSETAGIEDYVLDDLGPEGIDITWRYDQTDHAVKISVDMTLYMEEHTAYSREEGEQIISDLHYNFGTGDIENYKNALEDIIYKHIAHEIKTPGTERYDEIYKKIEGIAEDYKNFWADWNENNWAEGVDFIVRNKLPIEIPAFLRQVPREWKDNRRMEEAYERMYNAAFFLYERFIIRTLGDRDKMKGLYNDTIREYVGAAYTHAGRQTKLDFKDFDLGDAQKSLEHFGGSYFTTLNVILPTKLDLQKSHHQRIPMDPYASVKALSEITWLDKVEDLDFMVRWVDYMDKNWKQIMEEMRPAFEDISVQIKQKFKEVRSKFIKDIESWEANYRAALAQHDVPVTEDKKGKRIKIRMKKS